MSQSTSSTTVSAGARTTPASDTVTAPLPGFPTDDEALEHYRSRTGRRLEHLAWYRYLAAVRVAVLMHRYLRAMVHAGRLPADHTLFRGTVATCRLAELQP